MTPHKCPICNGSGKVLVDLYGNQNTVPFREEKCHACVNGIIYTDDSNGRKLLNPIHIVIEQANDKFIGWIDSPEYRGIVVQCDTLDRALNELGISVALKHQYNTERGD